ncbi:glutathione s-transferase, putative [Ricinus communis]|uniref:glutathione transferase n=1 Tax=Ricinus communis TaxID=3988 RepID=B9S8V9_RICCO|nr:glutathione s-transferase, putative [Ricinus communis]
MPDGVATVMATDQDQDPSLVNDHLVDAPVLGSKLQSSHLRTSSTIQKDKTKPYRGLTCSIKRIKSHKKRSTQKEKRMEKQQSEIVLYGTWGSGFCLRVELALKLKGITYEYVEEDLTNKSESLPQYNPVHKKLLPSSTVVIFSKGKEQEKAIKEFSELLTVFEEGIERDFPKEFRYNGETLGFLDIVVGAHGCNFRAFEEAVTVVVDPEKHPVIVSWIAAMRDCPLIRKTLPPHDKMVARLKEVFHQAPKV